MNTKTITIDSQALSTYLICRRKYQLRYLENLVPLEQPKYFLKGQIVHNLLKGFYRMKMSKKPFEKCLALGLRYLVSKCSSVLAPEDLFLLSQKYADYIKTYRNESYEPIGVEVGFSKILHADEELTIVYEGRIDLIVKLDNNVLWVDHKTQSVKEDLNPLSNQFLGYSWALGTGGMGIINYFGLQKSNDGFHRQAIYHKPSLIEEWRESVIEVCRLISKDQTFLKNRVSCKPYMCPRCEYFEICEQTNPAVIDNIKKTQFKLEEWQPWSTTIR